MTFSELRELVGNELMSRLAPWEGSIGLYYDSVPNASERLFVRFWFPFTGLYKSNYERIGTLDRPLLQVDVRHFPAVGSVDTPPPDISEAVWEALKFDRLPGLSGCVRQPDSRIPIKDSGDHSRWGWHRYQLYVPNTSN